MLRWEVEAGQSNQGDDLSDEAAVEDVFPGVAIVDGVSSDNRTDDDDEEDEAIGEASRKSVC